MSRPGATRIWADTIKRKTCEYRSCGQRLWMAQHVRTDGWMVFEGEPAAIAKTLEIGTHREEWTVDTALVHWARCPGAQRFRSRGRKGAEHVG